MVYSCALPRAETIFCAITPRPTKHGLRGHSIRSCVWHRYITCVLFVVESTQRTRNCQDRSDVSRPGRAPCAPRTKGPQVIYLCHTTHRYIGLQSCRRFRLSSVLRNRFKPTKHGLRGHSLRSFVWHRYITCVLFVVETTQRTRNRDRPEVSCSGRAHCAPKQKAHRYYTYATQPTVTSCCSRAALQAFQCFAQSLQGQPSMACTPLVTELCVA